MSSKAMATTKAKVDIKQMVGKYTGIIDDVMNSKTKTILDAMLNEFTPEKLAEFIADIPPLEFVRVMLKIQSMRQEEYLIVADLVKKMAQSLDLAVRINKEDPEKPEDDEDGAGTVAVPPELYAIFTRMSKKRISKQQMQMIEKILDAN